MNRTHKEIRAVVLESSKMAMQKLVKQRNKSATIPVPELPEGTYKVTMRDTDIDLRIGFNPENIREIWKRMKEAGWDCYRDVDTIIRKFKSGKDIYQYTTWYYNKGEDHYTLGAWIVMDAPGANCKQVRIGNETVTRPIYEIVCEEGIIEQALGG